MINETDATTEEYWEGRKKKMPAVSKKQQRFMGMVHAAQKGESPASPEVAKAAKSIKPSDAKEFASISTKGLPVKKKKLQPMGYKPGMEKMSGNKKSKLERTG